MKLSDYMRQHALSDDAMAALVGGCSASAVRKWKYGERMPRAGVLARIHDATEGHVTANDFLSIDPAGSARGTDDDTMPRAAGAVTGNGEGALP